eukprot:m.115605 g.115605  ORF g.115605 m.115605 type:complete len:351 (-) comp13097_c0_seq2:106-1158(-)
MAAPSMLRTGEGRIVPPLSHNCSVPVPPSLRKSHLRRRRMGPILALGVLLAESVLAVRQHCDSSGYCEQLPPERADYARQTERDEETIPFRGFPTVPLQRPWEEGVQTGVSLVGGNGVTAPDVLDTGPVPTECPPLVKPTDVHFILINLDQSKNRRRKMRAEFVRQGLPMFERVPGVLVTEANVDQHTPRRTSGSLKLADYGCALAHRRAWQRVVDGAHEWVVILEDDAELVDGVNLTDLPAVPHDADLLLFRAGTIMRWAAVCRDTEAFRAYWGFGMVGYLVSRSGAARLLAATAGGLDKPLDGVIWFTNAVYATQRDYIWHPPCDNPCPSSVRTWLNGELPNSLDFPD